MFSTINAQKSSGYFGKRFVVGFGLESFIAASNIDATDFKLYTKKFLSVDYAYKDFKTIGLKVGTYNSFFEPELIRRKGAGGYDYYSYTGDIKLKTKQFVVVNKFFKSSKGSIAPYGRYNMFNIGYIYTTTDNANFNLTGVGALPSNIDYTKNTTAFGDFLLEYGWGNNRIIYDNILIGYGFKFGFPVKQGLTDIVGIDSPDNKNSLDGDIAHSGAQVIAAKNYLDLFFDVKYLF